jgi:aspartate kinase
MRSHPGVAAKMYDTLAQAGINIDMISTSEIKVSVTIDLAKAEEAMRRVHAAFLG